MAVENRILAGRYQLLTKLGEGGMGSVWRAKHAELGTSVAVKLMDPQLASQPEWLARFKREAQAAAALDSPNVVRVFDFGVDDGTPYIAMELLSGESLAQRLRREKRLPPASVANIFLQIGRAISKAHDAGIVHRDLKPDNIYLTTDEGNEVAKVIDFGIAKRAHPDQSQSAALQTQTGALMGTPYYMSPEQASGAKHFDFRTDIWSLGVIVYQCIVGRLPFQADSLGGLVLAICTGPIPVPSHCELVPTGFDQWFARCVAREPNRRFATAREAVTQLASICASSTQLAKAPSGGMLETARIAEFQLPSGTRAVQQTDTGPAEPAHQFPTQPGVVTSTIPRLVGKARVSRLGLWIAAIGAVAIAAMVVGWLKLRPAPVASRPPAESAPSAATSIGTSLHGEVTIVPIVTVVDPVPQLVPQAPSVLVTAERPAASKHGALTTPANAKQQPSGSRKKATEARPFEQPVSQPAAITEPPTAAAAKTEDTTTNPFQTRR